MAKQKSIYVCSECGFETPKWMGQCGGCSAWNTLEETIKRDVGKKGFVGEKSSLIGGGGELPVKLSKVETCEETARIVTDIDEFNRVLGGGVVKGSITLIGGEPGIGKSTLLLQICQKIGQENKILYVTGEESMSQVSLRAKRLSVDTENLFLFAQTNTNIVLDTIEREKPDFVMIDSIQTMTIPEISSAAGSVAQVRESTNLFMQTAKRFGIPIMIVGHVNKDGAIAGPKVLEHIVDTVLYFEGDKNIGFRMLRTIKNRFGSTNEIGVFEMGRNGLTEVKNPSAALLLGRPVGVSGSVIGCVMEGSRAILAEVQSLVTKSFFTSPRRTSTGFDFNRLYMVIAVLEKRLGLSLYDSDIYLNVVGGLKLDDVSSDLAVAMSIISSKKDLAIADGCIAIGEIGLAGEIRAVSNLEKRINEAQRLGFKQCIIPKQGAKDVLKNCEFEIDIVPVKNIKEACLVAGI